MKATNELRERRDDAIAMVVAPAGPAMPRSVASPSATRLFSLVSLVALGAGVLVLARGGYLALTDAWVAPTRLSPDSREVVAVRVQASKEKEERARLESEVTSSGAEITAIDLSLGRLQALEEGYASAIRWSTSNRGDQLAALAEQKALLESQRTMALQSLEREKGLLERAKRNVDAGVIRAADADATEDSLARTELARSEKELEYVRVNAALAEAKREAAALVGAAARPPSPGKRGARAASPDVVRFDEVRISVELQIARLGAERRAAEARERAARAGIRSMDQLRAELDATPLFQAAVRAIDLAFVPYSHLKGVHAGDAVYACRWFLLGCRETGRIVRIFPGEVVTDDPWGSVARGQYAELEMSDRSAVAERTLRVRHANP